MHGQAKFAATWRTLLITAVLVGIVDLSSAAETGDLTDLRSKALELVNEAREQHGLPALQSRPELDRAAQAHAEDMLNRNYFDHVSPEGKTVFDRYVAAGGSRWRLVAENIGKCATCKRAPRIADVTRLQDGWMRSASHRENIMSPGVTQFGFGMVAMAGRGLYAVQSFAGPGTSPSPAARDEARRLSKSEQLALALDLINHARKQKGAPKLRPSTALTDALQSLIASIDMESELHDTASLSSELAMVQQRRWKSIAIIAAGCGGCGAEPAASDVRLLVQQWLDTPEYRETLLAPRFTHLGFTERVNGQGRKVALAALGVSP
jgi:uncharacterized protein YkwD